jgi:hypothetical protein
VETQSERSSEEGGRRQRLRLTEYPIGELLGKGDNEVATTATTGRGGCSGALYEQTP